MRAGWMEVALVALVGLAAHGQNTVALGDLRADDLLVTPAGAAAVAGQAAGLMLTNAVQAGYLCTVAAAHAIVAQAPTKAEMNAAVGGVAAQVAPLPGRISALEAGTNKWNAAHGWGDHSIRGYITAAALEPYATKVKLARVLADKVTTQALNAVVAPLVSTQKLAQALSELTAADIGVSTSPPTMIKNGATVISALDSGFLYPYFTGDGTQIFTNGIPGKWVFYTKDIVIADRADGLFLRPPAIFVFDNLPYPIPWNSAVYDGTNVTASVVGYPHIKAMFQYNYKSGVVPKHEFRFGFVDSVTDQQLSGTWFANSSDNSWGTNTVGGLFALYSGDSDVYFKYQTGASPSTDAYDMSTVKYPLADKIFVWEETALLRQDLKNYATTNYVNSAIAAIDVTENDPVAIPLLASHTNNASIHLTPAQVQIINESASTNYVNLALAAAHVPTYKWQDSSDDNIWWEAHGGTNLTAYRIGSIESNIYFWVSDDFQTDQGIKLPEQYFPMLRGQKSLEWYFDEWVIYDGGGTSYIDYSGGTATWYVTGLPSEEVGAPPEQVFNVNIPPYIIPVSHGGTGHGIVGWRSVTNFIPVNSYNLVNGDTITEWPSSSVPYTAWTGTVTPQDGTATVTYAHGNMPVLVVPDGGGITYVTIATDTYAATSGVSRVSLSIWAGANTIELVTNEVDYASAPDIPTDGWGTILFRRVSDGRWKGVGL